MRLETFLQQSHISETTLIYELELATDVQKNILAPKPHVSGMDIAVSFLPAENIGGDCYDFLTLPNGKTIMYVGDVTGHGIPAGIVMAMANAFFSSLSDFCGSATDMLIRGNSLLQKKVRPGTFMTSVMCEWDEANGKLTYASAGHEQIVHYSARKKELSLCPAGGIALGMLPDITGVVTSREIDFESGDIVFLYSDGIPEAFTDDRTMLGMDNFLEIIKRHIHISDSECVAQNILQDVFAFMNGHQQMDDMTLIVARRE